MEAEEKDRVKRLLHDRAICVVIPTYNNCGSIRQVVEDTLAYCDDVIVVNDGSTDGTLGILRCIPSVRLISYEKNHGKGYALKRGFLHALSMGFAYAITMDADGQFFPKDILAFLNANMQHPGALIIGNRIFKDAERTGGSKFANSFSNFWFYVQTGKRLADTQTGFRLYPLRKLSWLSLLTSRYEAELELLIFASWHGVEIVPIPVDVYYPPIEERVTHFRPFADFARISLLNTVLCLLAIVYGLPLRMFRFFAKWLRTIYSSLFFLFFSLFVFTPWVWLVIHLGKMNERKRRHLHWLIYKASRFVMIHHGIPGAKFRYKVAEETKFDKPRVIICNHQSHLDLVCQLVFTPNIIFLTNDWVWNNPFYGILIRNAEYLPVKDGIEVLLPHLRSLVDRGYSIAVFPEGTRSKDCRIGRFHKGALYIAHRLELEVLPMYLYGTGKVLKKNTYHLNKGMMYIEVDKPITTTQLAQLGDVREQTAAIHKHYQKKYESLANKIEQYA